jgi:phage terminase Nu1 subunit (DNA packaging protein)
MVGLTRQAISWAVRKDKIPCEQARGIDVNHPAVIEFMRRQKLEHDAQRAGHVPSGHERKSIKEEREKYGGTSGTQSAQDAPSSTNWLEEWTPAQKNFEETRLKKAQADAAILKYAEQLGAVVDIDSLNRIISKFMDFLLTELIYLPGNVSDVCWLKAKTSEVPEKAIEEVIADKIRDIVERGKKLTAELIPPPDGLNYVIMDPKDRGVEK